MSRREIDRLLGEAVRPQKRAFRIAGMFAVLSAVAGIFLLGLAGWFITAAALAGLGGVLVVQGFNYLLPSAAIRFLAILRTVSRYGERLYGHRAALMALATLRTRLFGHILRAPDVRAVSAGDMVGRLVQDIGALEDNLVRKPALPAALAGSAVGLAFSWFASPWGSLLLLLLLLAIVVGAHWATPHLLDKAATEMASALARLKESMVDHAAASPEILAYGLAPPIMRNLEQEAAALDRAQCRFARREAMIDAALTMGGGMAMVAVLILSKAALPITVLAVLAAAGAVESLSFYVRGVSRHALVATAFSRLQSLANSQEPARKGSSPLPQGCRLSIRGIEIGPGSRLGISGPSGSGKTMLLEELAGIRPAENSGHILLDGQPLAGFSADVLRGFFALSPQDALLLSGTVGDNLRIARPGLTDGRLWEALETACLAPDIRAMPQGLDQWIGNGGARLSGGQRKRLSVARALLAGRPWLLLDEPSEGLDPATEARLCNHLGRWLQESGTGLVVVSHRPALLALAEQQLIL